MALVPQEDFIIKYHNSIFLSYLGDSEGRDAGLVMALGPGEERSTGASRASSSSCQEGSSSRVLLVRSGLEILTFRRSRHDCLLAEEAGACTMTLCLFRFSNSEGRRSEEKVFDLLNFLWMYFSRRLSSVTSSWESSVSTSSLIWTWRGSGEDQYCLLEDVAPSSSEEDSGSLCRLVSPSALYWEGIEMTLVLSRSGRGAEV